jgi:hypothetical protein
MEKTKYNYFFFACISTLWILLGLFFLSDDFTQNLQSYKILMRLSLDGKRAITTGVDFYQFLMFCDKIIPERENIKWVFPEGAFLGNSEYHFYKAYYFLYPRHYQENADYIIVYGREGYAAPQGYGIFAGYGKEKYILHKT